MSSALTAFQSKHVSIENCADSTGVGLAIINNFVNGSSLRDSSCKCQSHNHENLFCLAQCHLPEVSVSDLDDESMDVADELIVCRKGTSPSPALLIEDPMNSSI